MKKPVIGSIDDSQDTFDYAKTQADSARQLRAYSNCLRTY